MPESLKARIAADVREIASDPAIAERLKPTGSTMQPGNAAEFAAAIERKQVALEAQIQSQYEAEKTRLLASGRADALEIEARARARALEVVGKALATNPQLLNYYYIDRLSPNIRAMLIPAGNQLILPLPDLMGTSPLTATVPLSSTDVLSSTTLLPARCAS